MICSFVLGIYPEQTGERIFKYENYNYLRKIMLEEKFSIEETKKITVSNFLTRDSNFENKNYYIKISSIDSECTLKLLKLLFFYKITSHIISMKNINFRITNIYHNSIWAKQFDFEEFIKLGLRKDIELKILTPIFFKIGNEYVTSLEPVYVFKNLMKKVKKSSICNEKILENIKTFDINKISIKEKSIIEKEIKNIGTKGIVGNVIYKVKSYDEEDIKFFNFLLYFSYFSGIGYLTEKGYGQVIGLY